MKRDITIEEADVLLEKYYEGATTKAEEALLRDFLLQEDLPERFEAERAIIGYFIAEKKQSSDIEHALQPKAPLFQLTPILKWSLAAAVLLFGVFILESRLQVQNRNVAYVNGVRLTDSQSIKALAIASIQDLDLGSDEVAGTVDAMNDANLVESQLQQFPELK